MYLLARVVGERVDEAKGFAARCRRLTFDFDPLAVNAALAARAQFHLG